MVHRAPRLVSIEVSGLLLKMPLLTATFSSCLVVRKDEG